MSKEGLMQFDPWSAVVIALTLVLFLASVFVKGFTHDLLLEAGVFLVSVKLILMAQKNTAFAQVTDQRLERIATLLEGIKNQPRAQR
jgi:protein-S-isoprenylcysteine O-methyltransferase Ste14